VGGLGQVGIGLQGWVNHLHWPPFWGGYGDFVIVARPVTANQRPDPGATVLVCKDWPDQANRFRLPLEPALHGGLLCKIQFAYPDKTLFLSIRFTQGDESVVLQCGDKLSILARDEIKVFLGGKPAIHEHEAAFQGVAHAGLDPLAQEFVFRDLAFSLDLPGLDVAVLKRFLHPLKRQRNGRPVAGVQRVEKVDPSDRPTAARVKMPTHEFALVRPGLLLGRVVKNQHAALPLHRPDCRFDLPP